MKHRGMIGSRQGLSQAWSLMGFAEPEMFRSGVGQICKKGLVQGTFEHDGANNIDGTNAAKSVPGTSSSRVASR